MLGLRPSAFEDASLHPDDGATTVTVPVDVVEELGSEVNLIFTVDAPPANTELVHAADEAEEEALNVPFVAAENQCICTARVDARTHVEAGQQATLRVNMDGAHFFDPESGARDRRQAAGRNARGVALPELTVTVQSSSTCTSSTECTAGRSLGLSGGVRNGS